MDSLELDMPEYITAGGNRHPAAADWDSKTGLLAFGADRNVALWQPKNQDSKGISTLLSGHADTVNAVKFLLHASGSLLLSGSVDKTVRIWICKDTTLCDFECVATLTDHQSSVNCIAVFAGVAVFATGSADASVKIWKITEAESKIEVQLLQTIQITPRFFPLCLALSPLIKPDGPLILAVAGTRSIIQLYLAHRTEEKSVDFRLQATLSGHEGWVRSLAFARENADSESDLILSSASQDKYIRLWRVHRGKELPVAAAAGSDPAAGAFLPGKSLSNKAHRFTAAGLDYSATFEALLLGHDDWIYSTSWRTDGGKLQLLSASADNSLAIWEPDESSGIWVCITRLGEISGQKGSTTATGSTGGFWNGLWSPNGKAVTCIGRTGSWRIWNHDESQDRWVQGVGIGGHTLPVTGIAWSTNGDYLLSTSSDQTTRLHARWKRSGKETWHEIARPQIHGYDLNCVDSFGDAQFVSGADEKLLRVFKEPKAVADLLYKLCGLERPEVQDMPDAANIPVLGLSNKAIQAVEDDVQGKNGDVDEHEAVDPASVLHKSTLAIENPPLEDHLSKHTLWPEVEKLYGHGYEISALATSHDGSLIATACKASSIDHAVIRLFETKNWTEVKPPLTAHSLTVARLRFSADDEYLLSVGRDRQWAVFLRSETDSKIYNLTDSNPKGHSRMILDAAWAPLPLRAFATAGRDKQVRLWELGSGEDQQASLKDTIAAEHLVTAVDFLPSFSNDQVYLAMGTETGRLSLHHIDVKTLGVLKSFALNQRSCPAKAITQLSWKPILESGKKEIKLAVASEDSSLRIFSLNRFLVLRK